MKNAQRVRRVSAEFTLGASVVVLAILAGASTALLPIQIIAIVVAVLVALVLQSRTRVLVMVSLIVPTAGLFRRLLSGESGYTDSDPLVLLPLVLLLGVLGASILVKSQPQRSGGWIVAAGIGVAISTVATLALRLAFTVDSLFFALSLAVPVLVIVAVVSGKLPDAWPAVERVIPWLGLLVGAYGVYQFLALPPWDSAWMITTDLSTVGRARPLEVRVFGASESPGPYASYMGLAAVIAMTRAVLTETVPSRAGWFALSAALAVPLLLSGVRSALLAALVCAALLVLVRGRGVGRVAPIALIVIVGLLLSRIIDAVGGSSTILNNDRYGDLTNDHSLQARLGLLGYLINPLAYIVGTPSPGRLDNMTIDVMVSYGVVAGIGITVIFAGGATLAIRNLRFQVNEGASLVAIYCLVMSVSGNLFASPFGILAALAVASTARGWLDHRSSAPKALLEHLQHPQSRVHQLLPPESRSQREVLGNEAHVSVYRRAGRVAVERQ